MFATVNRSGVAAAPDGRKLFVLPEPKTSIFDVVNGRIAAIHLFVEFHPSPPALPSEWREMTPA
jgi:hypothetical protein